MSYTYTPTPTQMNKENSSKFYLGMWQCVCECMTLLPAPLVAQECERESNLKWRQGNDTDNGYPTIKLRLCSVKERQ